MPEKEARYRCLAARKAADMGARETAIYHLNLLETILNESSISKTENVDLSKKLYGLRGNLYALIPVPEKARSDFRQLEVLAKADNDTCTMARALCGYGIIERSLGNFDSALSYVSQVDEITPEECTDVVADCKLLAAKTYKDKGEYEQAAKWAAMAQSLYEQIGNQSGILDARSQIAYRYYARGQYDEAKEIWMKNLAKAPQLATVPPDFDDDVYFCLGFLHWRLGEHDMAKGFFSTALEAAQQMNNQRKQAYCLNDLCFVETSLGNYDKAESNAREALLMFKDFGDKKGLAWANGNLGNALAHAGKLECAVKFLSEGRLIAEEIGLKSSVAEDSRRLSLVYLNLSNFSEAYRYALHALEEAKAIDRQAFVGIAYRVLGEIAAQAKFKPGVNLIDIQDPEAYFKLSVEIAQKTENKSEEAEALRAWGQYLVKLPDSPSNKKGEELLQKAASLR
jgi:tetratricopeptide (TPR) repeat protein